MDALQQYLISVTAAAIICAIVKTIGDGKSFSGAVMRLLASVILTLTVLSGVITMELGSLPALSEAMLDDTRVAVAQGENMAAQQRNSIIIEALQTYILDKAGDFGAELEVEFIMDDTGLHPPEGIILRGPVSPYAKQRLQQIISEDLDIAKEKQQWTE